MVNMIGAILVPVHVKGRLLFTSLFFTRYMVICRYQAPLVQFFYNSTMVACAMFGIPLCVAVEVSDYHGLRPKPIQIDRLIYVVFFYIRLTCPNTQYVHSVAYFHRHKVRKAIAWPVIPLEL